MGDEKVVRMNRSIKKEEEIVLIRSLLRDGMTQKQAERYIEVVKKEVKKNHKKHIKRINKEKTQKNKIFVKEFKKITKRK